MLDVVLASTELLDDEEALKGSKKRSALTDKRPVRLVPLEEDDLAELLEFVVLCFELLEDDEPEEVIELAESRLASVDNEPLRSVSPDVDTLLDKPLEELEDMLDVV